eukprot:gnl/TRDRNA2_/TRDRNA2_98918_c0_seq1.p1 gnl/TRDRNA2_/TRDRNA2_98918_c0~~gnl/TRDRNA2_/TRDRNA2_98918_c0_seq1.p1  ORF type:complete len:171 (+),score=23.20 gnl/TRDRNA2_/TRDRNA2_98918_c0_seq1:42-515(+)
MWAPVGVDETTMEPTRYMFPGEPCAIFWDLPGAGTSKWPLDTYSRRVGLRHFDVVLIVCANRFTKVDIVLMDELKEHRVPYFAVRQKINSDIANNENINGIEANETMSTITEELWHQGVDNPYLVDSFTPLNHDLPKLFRDIQAAIVAHRKCGKGEL